MAHVAPTPAEFKARHTAFAALSDPVIQAILTEANRSVDTTWTEGDYKNAIMYLAAHILTTEGALDSTVIGKPGLISSESLGDASTSYAVAKSSRYEGELGSTIYGRRYLDLMRVNVGGPIVI